ncbi:MAG: hypothetical protein ACNYPD_06775, partial [Candidatus Halichondribacter symbioticus]
MKFFFQNNVTYTRGALLALFAGLFILAACGGVTVAPTIIVNDPPADSPCVTNPYGSTCTEEKVAAIDLCREAIAGGDDCADNTPEAVVSCLTDPFSTACTTAQATENPFEGTEITIAKEQEKRQEACLRSDTTALCGTAVSRLCSANPFTQTTGDTPTNLCVDISGTAYADARDTFCRDEAVENDANCATRKDAICETNGSNVFAPLCGTAITTGQQTACETLSQTDQPRCTGIVTAFCDTPTTPADIYDDLCNTGYDSQRLSYCQDADTNISEATNNCAGDLAGICTTNGGSAPFSGICGTNGANQRIFCRANLSNGLCTNTILTFCTNPATASDIYDDLCNTGYDSQRLSYCQAADTNISEASGNCAGDLAAICTTGGGSAPFSGICGTNGANQRIFCRANLSDGLCTDTILTFCTNPTPASNIYDRLCDTGYTSERLSYCQDADTNISEAAGNCSSDLAAICTTGGGSAPFAGICGTAITTEQQEVCRLMLQSAQPLCTAVVQDFCDSPDSPVDIYDLLCRVGYATPRLNYCKAEGTNFSEAAGNCSSDLAAICTTGGGSAPFAGICGDAITTEQQEVCRLMLQSAQPRCSAVVQDFCDSPDSPVDIYDLLCRVGYATPRLDYCKAEGTNFSEAAGNCSSDLAAICTTGGGSAPFAGICGATITTEQQEVCRLMLQSAQPRCSAVVQDFCDSPDSPVDIYDLLC